MVIAINTAAWTISIPVVIVFAIALNEVRRRR